MKLNLDYIHNILLEIESTSAKAIFLSPNFSQDIYNLLGIAGFLLSAILFLSQLVTHRRNISLKIYDYKKIATIVQIFKYPEQFFCEPMYPFLFNHKWLQNIPLRINP